MDDLKGVDCWTDGHTWFSKAFPNRAAQRVAFGFAIYEKQGDVGVHRGLCFDDGAHQWLSGEDLENISERVKVEGVTVE